MAERYWIETLGCPKNQVDSDKLVGTLTRDGFEAAPSPGDADLVVVNTCAFIEAARQESVETVLSLADARRDGARLVVTGCMAERYGDELARALPEVDLVAPFGASLTTTAAPTAPAPAPVAVALGAKPAPAGPAERVPDFDLLNLARPTAAAPWAYVKVAEGCDRNCGFCAIPSFRGVQRSRDAASVLAEVEAVGAREVVLVAQDLVSWGRDASTRAERRNAAADGPNLAWLVREVRRRVDRVRLLYIYPSGLTDELVEVIGESGCPYYDLSLQHVSEPLLRRMRRPGSAERFAEKVASVRRRYPDAVLRSSFIVGYPGETEEDHDQLLAFLRAAELDWVGFFPYSREEGTHAAGLPGQVPAPLVAERLRECSELQDGITAARRSALVGGRCTVLVDAPGQGRSHREAPEVDGVVQLPADVPSGGWVQVEVVDSVGPDLVGLPLGPVRQP